MLTSSGASKKTILNGLFLLLAVAVPFVIYAYTRSDSLSFSDAGEFALVTKIASVAHGPGFPAYVMFGWIWCTIASFFTGSHLASIMLFSIASTAAACGILYITSYRLLQRLYPDYKNILHQVISLCIVFVFAFGFTAWYWANNVEVYAFHALTFSLMMYGLIEFNSSRKTRDLVIAAVGVALGLATHHLTTIFFLPFIFVFFGKNIFSSNKNINEASKKKSKEQKANSASVLTFLKSKQFKIFLYINAGLLIFFYGWMMLRASADLPFKFGQPDTLSRLFFHISGGAWIKGMTARTEGVAGLRFPYFIWLLQRQFGFFLLVLAIGIIELFRKRYYLFATAVLGYFLLMQCYQLGLDQFFDSDGYMLSSYYLLALILPFGIMWMFRKKKQLIWILPAFLLMQTVRNFPLDDKRDHNISKSLMQTLDESAPKNSVILVADWTLAAQYYYYRIAENFRPDLVFLNYDLKFTNYKILPTLYPEFYKKIKPEYDDFVEKLREAHPEQVYNTGASFDTDEILAAYKKVIDKIKTVCAAANTPVLMDPQAFVFMDNQKIVSRDFYPSGCFISNVKTNATCCLEKLPFKWLDNPIITHEQGATDKLVDILAMLKFNSIYLNSIGDSTRDRETIQSYDHILAIQREMKTNLPFIYRNKGPVEL